MEHWRNLQAEALVRVQAQERGKWFAFRILLLRVCKQMYIGSYTVCMLVMLLTCALMHTGSYTIQCVHTCAVLKIDRHVLELHFLCRLYHSLEQIMIILASQNSPLNPLYSCK